jgi:DNA polymerase I-like protein with 3'-5' exonuclease and polymerase domains
MIHPNLIGAKVIGIDIETYDPGLEEEGAGVFRGDGQILGVSIAAEGFNDYFNIAHKGITQEEHDGNIAWLRDTLGNNVPKIGANLMYDISWLEDGELKIPVNGRLHDVQVAEPLLDEYADSYALDVLGKKYCNAGKNDGEIIAWCAARGLKGKPQKYLYQMPYDVVRRYAKPDTTLPMEIYKKQYPKLMEEGLFDLYTMEMKLYRPLLQMKRTGVRIDENRLRLEATKMRKSIDALTKSLYDQYGYFNFNSSKQLAELFDTLGIAYGKTAKGNPSIDKDFLEYCEHPVARQLFEVRKAEKILSTFLLGAFTDYDIDGRIHCEFKPLRRDDGGTVSGRFSSSNPNLQQVPRPDDDDFGSYGKVCRSLFIPEEGCLWGKIDYSQIEYRFIASYAYGKTPAEIRSAEGIRAKYKEDPHTDYHKFVMALTGLERPDAKRANFGMAYFMGIASMMRKFHWSEAKATHVADVYFANVQFMRPTRSRVVSIAEGRGYIKTVLGRRARVSQEMRESGKIYPMFNRLIQGSAADLMKKSIVDAYEAGVFNEITPHITVHDELGLSVPETRVGLEAYRELKHIMEMAIKINVPIIADAELGPNWGETEEFNFNDKIYADVQNYRFPFAVTRKTEYQYTHLGATPNEA